MSKWAAALVCLIPQALLAGCLSLVEPPIDSDCTRTITDLTWLNSSRLLQRVKLPRLSYDRLLYDTAFSQGLSLAGDLEFDLRVSGPHLVEVFLAAGEEGGFVELVSGGENIDARTVPAKAGGWRSVTLLAILQGRFTVRASTRIVLSAIRWTPQKQFDDVLAPEWVDRSRKLSADPFLESLKAGRRENLEQIYARLALSSKPEIRREAIIGKARVAYWLAAKTQNPDDLDAAASSLREAFTLAPEDKIVREMASAACGERNVPKGGRMPYGAFCIDAVPVFWTVTVEPDPPETPEWAASQKRLAVRLEAITRWWVEQRQQLGGELGGGMEEDLELARQWVLQAQGFGSAAASTGINRFPQQAVGRDPVVETPPSKYGERLPLEVLWNMVSLARDSEKALARDFAMYTSEVIYTDRVYYPLTPEYWRYLLGGEGSEPLAVSWPVSQTEFARAVVDSTATSLKLRLYSFAAKAASVPVILRRLNPGTYRWETSNTIGTLIASGDIVIRPQSRTLNIPLPPARDIEVSIRQVKP